MGGFFGTISTKECIDDLFYGTDYNSHLGTKRAGMVTFDKEKGFSRSIHSLERDYFRSKFEDELASFHGKQGLGVISDTDPQPIIVNSHLGRYAVVTVAKINNQKEIANELLSKRMHFSEMSANNINQTELVALLINMGSTFVEGINLVYNKIKGSCSMLILTEDGIIAARDYMGRTPIVMGKKEGAFAVTSETSAFPNLDFATVRDIGPGEIVKIKADGFEVLQQPAPCKQICSFLWVYYGFPASDYEGINVEDMRERNGRLMGEEDHTEADCVCGIPDSGVGIALGYAEGHKIPYKRAVLKYTPTWPRSFTPGNQSRRNLVAKMKLIPNKAILEGQRVVFCDDSIVRGTQLRDNVKMFFDYGAKEVHARISCPPLVYGCPFIGFTSSKSDLELITRCVIKDFEGDEHAKLKEYATTDSPEYQRMVKEIAKRLGLTTLKFNKIETLIKSIGLPKCQVCTHCFDGSSRFHEPTEETQCHPSDLSGE
ncbi:MAG: amidophosphoribosyltransferase [Prevotella sp.]|nr:amidophosphoribosyltransferase [Prevotella sp.]